MAAFHQHVAFSAFSGIAYGATLWYTEYVDAPVAGLAAAVCTFGGVLPDLDADSGKPVRELFHLLGTAGAVVTLHRLKTHPLTAGDSLALFPVLSAELTLLLAVGVYFALRYGAAVLFGWLTVHRGMFHSLPAAILAGEITYLVYDSCCLHARRAVALGMTLGYLSHLLLDAIWNLRTTKLIAPLSPCSPLKLLGDSRIANLVCWLWLLATSYLIAVQQCWVTPIEPYSAQVLRALELPVSSGPANLCGR